MITVAEQINRSNKTTNNFENEVYGFINEDPRYKDIQSQLKQEQHMRDGTYKPQHIDDKISADALDMMIMENECMQSRKVSRNDSDKVFKTQLAN